MCLIIVKRHAAGTEIPAEFINNACDHNRDGFGIIGRTPDGTVYTAKTMDMTEAEGIIRTFEKNEADIVCHFRYATHGTVNELNCHPFRVGNSDNFIVHNGILPIPIHRKERSDTWHFVEQLGSHVHKHGYNRKEVKRFMKRNARTIQGNKFAVLGENIPLTIINEHLGTEIDGIWYSNKYSTQPKHRPVAKPFYLSDMPLWAQEIGELDDEPDYEGQFGVCQMCDCLIDDPESEWCDDCFQDLFQPKSKTVGEIIDSMPTTAGWPGDRVPFGRSDDND